MSSYDMNKLITDDYMKNVRQLLLEIPDTITKENMEQILDKLEEIGFKKCGFSTIHIAKRKFYSVGLLNNYM